MANLQWHQATYLGESDPAGFQHGQTYTIRVVHGLFSEYAIQCQELPNEQVEYLELAVLRSHWKLNAPSEQKGGPAHG